MSQGFSWCVLRWLFPEAMAGGLGLCLSRKPAGPSIRSLFPLHFLRTDEGTGEWSLWSRTLPPAYEGRLTSRKRKQALTRGNGQSEFDAASSVSIFVFVALCGPYHCGH